MVWRATGPIHGGSSVESVFEPATLRSRGRDLTTRPPRPQQNSGRTLKKSLKQMVDDLYKEHHILNSELTQTILFRYRCRLLVVVPVCHCVAITSTEIL
ncbi:hypothetical protein AVEN_154146-1 [Araneus ventricosus]|uniref:Uncharacterized protein n=1 Tax=Araneus ventricosus TaxID=182803 RepID=A0A4Y2TTV4_ARAVE|nr:hypothetical protein AVEN_154146-1 [Araneus ventricosus]